METMEQQLLQMQQQMAEMGARIMEQSEQMLRQQAEIAKQQAELTELRKGDRPGGRLVDPSIRVQVLHVLRYKIECFIVYSMSVI